MLHLRSESGHHVLKATFRVGSSPPGDRKRPPRPLRSRAVRLKLTQLRNRVHYGPNIPGSPEGLVLAPHESLYCAGIWSPPPRPKQRPRPRVARTPTAMLARSGRLSSFNKELAELVAGPTRVNIDDMPAPLRDKCHVRRWQHPRSNRSVPRDAECNRQLNLVCDPRANQAPDIVGQLPAQLNVPPEQRAPRSPGIQDAMSASQPLGPCPTFGVKKRTWRRNHAGSNPLGDHF